MPIGPAIFEVAIIGIGYTLPTIIAHARFHINVGPIFIANLCLGWTGIGWLICLIWAFTHQPESATIETQRSNDNGKRSCKNRN